MKLSCSISISILSCSRPCLVLVLFLLGACRSTTPVDDGPALPFHVVLSPTTLEPYERPTGTPVEASSAQLVEGERDDDMRLDLTTDDITGMLERELAPAFVQVTRLSMTDEDQGELAGKSPRECQRYWAAKARDKGANLLLSTELLIDPKISGERNEKFWLNLPLFLLGGPMCWFVGDRSYEAEVELEAEFFEVTQEEDDLDKISLLPSSLKVKFEGTDLRFIDRADGAGDYGLSILIPAGFLAPKSEDVEKELEDRLPGQLGQQLKTEVFAKREFIEVKRELGAYKLESLSAPIKRSGRLIIPVQELASGSLLRYELSTDGQFPWRKSDDFGAGDPSGRHVIDTDVQLPADASYLTVTVVDTKAKKRSYTFPIENPPPGG